MLQYPQPPIIFLSTSLTDEDGHAIETDSTTIMGTFLHGTNTGTHTCTATSRGNDEDESYLVTVEGMYSFLFIMIIKITIM